MLQYDEFITHSMDIIMGKPKSGKTRIAGSYPWPLLYISVGNDGGGRVLKTAYPEACANGQIKVINLRNDMPVNRKINKTSIEKLAEILRDLRDPTADKFKTIVIDTLSGLQDDYKTYLEFTKGGMSLSQQEWGDVAKMMMNIKDNIKRFSEEQHVQFVLITHTTEQEVYETSGLNKEIRIIPDLTIKTGVKFMKDASNIFYCCRKTIIDKTTGNKTVKFLTYVGPHPLMDTGTRDMSLAVGAFIEDFSYSKWQQMIKTGSLDVADVAIPDNTEQTNKQEGEE